jgi:aryl-alcohol dehydrogenase-like predicted oxidoreductase
VLSNQDIARIWFGCGNFGGIGSSPSLRGVGDSGAQALVLLDHVRRLGLRRFDTANTYGGGQSEIILGKWLRAQGAAYRDTVQIATKVGNPNGCPRGETPLSARQIAHHLDESLRRLGVERIDLYYIHEFDRVTPLQETLEAMAVAVEAGKIDRFGVSNASATDVRVVKNRARAALASRFEYVQNEYNLLALDDAATLIPWCAENGFRYTAFSPLAGGLLTGKYRLGEEPPPGSRLAHAREIYSDYLNAESFAAIERLRRAAEERQTTMAEAALHFVLDTPGIEGLIVAPRSLEQFASLGFASG